MLQHCNVAVATAAAAPAAAASIFDLSYVACNARPISRWPTANRKCCTASTSASLYLFIAAAGARQPALALALRSHSQLQLQPSLCNCGRCCWYLRLNGVRQIMAKSVLRRTLNYATMRLPLSLCSSLLFLPSPYLTPLQWVQRELNALPAISLRLTFKCCCWLKQEVEGWRGEWEQLSAAQVGSQLAMPARLTARSSGLIGRDLINVY